MVEAISGYYCNIITANDVNGAATSAVVVNNDIYSDSKLTGNVIYSVGNGYSYDRTPGVRNKGLKQKRIYNGKTLNPPICDPGASLANISTDISNPTIVDLTNNLIVPQLRGSGNNQYYLRFDLSPYTFYSVQEFNVGGWPNAKYRITIPTRSYTFNINLEFPNDNKIYTFYVDYQNNKVYYI